MISIAPDLLTAHGNWYAWAFLVGGLIITAALIPYLLLRLRRAIKIEVLVTKLSRSNEDLGLEMAHRERAEEDLRDNEERFRQMAENIREVFFLVDQENRKLLYINSAVEDVWGRTRQSFYENPAVWLEAVHPEDFDRVHAAFQKQQVTGEFDEEFRIIRPDGSVRWVLERVTPIRNEHGEVYRLVGITEDVTQRRRLTAQLLTAERMESMGRLAGGIAHDFNNLLTLIRGYAKLLRDSPDSPSQAWADLEAIDEATDRAVVLVSQLMAFSPNQVGRPEAVNLNDSVLNLYPMLRRLIAENIELVTLPGPDLGMAKVDQSQFEQVIVNLAVNARDAMPDGGTLTIETANVALNDDFTRQPIEVSPGDYVVLMVSDTGIGMTEELKQRVFDPFFTTKDVGKGTGLGLSTCYGIVNQHGGHINVHSEPGSGSTFKVYLRRTEEQAGSPNMDRESTDKPMGAETILLVEDSSEVRHLAARVLREYGYDVLEAANGEQAFRTVETYNEKQIDLVVTDLVMPQMGGMELVEKLKVARPDTRALLTSGYTHGIDDESLNLGVRFLQKPYLPVKLAWAVREALDE